MILTNHRDKSPEGLFLNDAFGLFFCSFLIIFLLTGCKKDFNIDKVKDFTWNPDFAVPLVSDSITFEEALIETGTEKNFYIDESGDVSILYYYRNDAFKIRPADLLDIPSCSFDFSHQVTFLERQVLDSSDLPLPPVTYPVNLLENVPGARIDKLVVKEGTLTVTTDNTFSNDGYLILRILNATQNDSPFSARIEPFREGITQTQVDLSGVVMDMTSSPSTVIVQIEGLLKESDSPEEGDVFAVQCSIDISVIGWFEGYLGQQTFSLPRDTVRITVFNNAYVLGDIHFVDPKTSITIYNSIGIPALLTVEELIAVNDASGIVQDIGDRLGSGAVVAVPSPEIGATKPVVKVQTYSNANTGNSMDEIFNLKPDRVIYKVKTTVNPESGSINFFSDSSSLFADLKVIFPLYGHFDHLTVQDTFDFELPQKEYIERVQFKMDMVNGLPLAARIQVFFTDQSYNILDSLTGEDNILICEAPVDPMTHLPIPGMYGVKDTSFYFDQARMDGLKPARKILVRGVMTSSNGGGGVDVKIRADQLMIINIAARVKLQKNIDPGN